MRSRERQTAWREIEDFMKTFPHRVNEIYHFADLFGYPSGDGGRSNSISDRTGTIATNHASGRYDDPSIMVAKKLDKWLQKTLGEIRHLDSEMRRCEPEDGFKIEDLDQCEDCGKPRSITRDMVLGKCRSCYNKQNYQQRKKGKK